MSETTKTTATPRPSVTAEISGDTVSITHNGSFVGSINGADVGADARDKLVLFGARAILASARTAEGVASRIEALRSGKTSTREPGKSKEVSPLVRAIGLADAHKAAQEAEPKISARLPGGKPNPAYDALVASATAAAAALDKDAKRAAKKRKDVMIRLADLVGG